MPTGEPTSPIRLATRASRLALWQAHHVQALLHGISPQRSVEIIEVSTIGDRDRDSRLAEMGGQGVFTREVQNAVLEGRADIAVHSLKDLPTEVADGLVLRGIPQRAERWDVLIAPSGKTVSSLDQIPRGAKIATGSMRRRAQLLHARPDFQMCEVRGNVETRLKKLDEGEFEILILAEAGLERLGLAERISARLLPPTVLPAVGQAALGLECRANDLDTQALLHRITHHETLVEILAERACLRTLRAGCHAPVGVLAHLQPEHRLTLDAVVLSSDGKQRLHYQGSGDATHPEQVGIDVAEQLIALGAAPLLGPTSQLAVTDGPSTERAG